MKKGHYVRTETYSAALDEVFDQGIDVVCHDCLDVKPALGIQNLEITEMWEWDMCGDIGNCVFCNSEVG